MRHCPFKNNYFIVINPAIRLKILSDIRKHLPTAKEVHDFRYIHIFGDTLKQAELWAFNRNSVAKGIATGLFCAFLPMPFETIVAIFIAAMIGGHLAFAVAGVWISNPLTWIPLYTPCYLLGTRLIGIDPIPLHEISILQFGWHYVALWLGCLIIGGAVGLASHFVVSMLWRVHIVRRWQHRRAMRRARKAYAVKK